MPSDVVAGEATAVVVCPVHNRNPVRPCWACHKPNGISGHVPLGWYLRWVAAGSPLLDPEHDR